MTTKTPHPHAEFIIEWMKDTSREIQLFSVCEQAWVTITEPSWGNDRQYRFADTVEQKPKIVSSLTDQQIRNLYDAERRPFESDARNAANAAAQRAIEDIEEPPGDWIFTNLSPNLELGRYNQVRHVLAVFIKELKEGKL